MTSAAPKTVLIVDDEDLFLRTVADGFVAHSKRVNVLTAPNGKSALDILERCSVDLVVTDLRMPEMDGFDLLSHISRSRPELPVIVMTAFGTSEIERRLEGHGIAQYLDKPLDFPALAERVFQTLSASASGHLQGISLPTLLQMIEADRKTCTLRVRFGQLTGLLFLREGKLLDAELGPMHGEAAALAIVGWGNPEIEILGGWVQHARCIKSSLAKLLLEGLRQKDEKEREGRRVGKVEDAQVSSDNNEDDIFMESTPKEIEAMAASDKLKELQNIEEFAGAAVYTPTGEVLAMLVGDNQRLKEVGILANNVLLNAQKASIEMGTGRGQQVHIEAEKAHILVRCLNEGTDPLKSSPGKAHIHMVLVLHGESSIGLAKMRLNSLIEKLAEDFRM